MTQIKYFIFIFLFSSSQCVFLGAQYANSPLDQYPDEWNAEWITHPSIDKAAYGLIHFRRSFTLRQLPDSCIIHITGDNRYRLYVNGTEVGYGPQLADIRHWRYETIDLAPYLQVGVNVIAAEVMNWGVERSYGIISHKTGLLIQGHSTSQHFLNTHADSSWKVVKNGGMFEKPVHWRGGGEVIGGFYAGNPTDSVVASRYEWGWQQIDFDDLHWMRPHAIFSKPKTNTGYGHGWILQPRTTARQKDMHEKLGAVFKTDLSTLEKGFRFGSKPLEIPPGTKCTLEIDQGYVTLGYPKVRLSGGRNAKVKIKYSEAMYDDENQKGNRNVTNGKKVKGISDVIVMDGGQNRLFQPIWFRAFRFIEVSVETGEDPLIIEDFYNVFSATEFPIRGSFESPDTLLTQIWDLCAHTLKICAQDNMISDAYYEQLQYVGDLRPHLMAWTSLTGDFSYFHNALEQFNNSRLPDGNITSCYPLKATFVIPPYSLIWIDMLYDLMMWEGDPLQIETYTGEIQEVFDYYESIINENGLVGKSGHHMFIDWYVPKGGNSRVNKDGNSAILTLNYAYTLLHAAEIMRWLGHDVKATLYRNRAVQIANKVKELCFDNVKGIYTDDPERTFYDQRASILAVLCGAHSEEDSRMIMQKALDNRTQFDSRANLFYYFYLFEAMQKTGIGDFNAELQPWKDMLTMGLSGTPEKRLEQDPRSEVHPWTAHPVHFYFRILAGIKPIRPGFKAVDIRPSPGSLKEIKCNYPTVNGAIIQHLRFDNNQNVNGTIFLPAGTEGNFYWQGKKIALGEGANKIN